LDSPEIAWFGARSATVSRSAIRDHQEMIKMSQPRSISVPPTLKQRMVLVAIFILSLALAWFAVVSSDPLAASLCCSSRHDAPIAARSGALRP
jgi:hypothetical protein